MPEEKGHCRTDQVDSLFQGASLVIINIIPQRRSSRASDLCRPLSVRVRYKMHVSDRRPEASKSFAFLLHVRHKTGPTPRRATYPAVVDSLYPLDRTILNRWTCRPHNFSRYRVRITATQTCVSACDFVTTSNKRAVILFFFFFAYVEQVFVSRINLTA